MLKKIPKFDEVKEWAIEQGWVTSQEAQDAAPVQSVNGSTGDVEVEQVNDFEQIENRDMSLLENRDYGLLENKPNRVTESGSVSVGSNFNFVEFEITFSTSFSEITSIHTGIDGDVSSFNDTRSAYETTLVEFDENGMTVNAMPCQENSGNLRWTVWGIES